MKKAFIFMILAFFSVLIYIPNAYAITYYEDVTIRTAFDESININNIEWIEVFIEDSTEYSKSYILNKYNNFTLNVDDLPIGQLIFQYGVVNDDEIGYYRVSADINIYNETKKADVYVIVTLQNNQVYERIPLTEEDVNNIIGSNTNEDETLKDNNNKNDEIIIGKNESEKNDSEEEEIPDEIKEAREKEKLEQKKEENRKKSNMIGRIMFSIIGIILAMGIIFVAIKISRANK